MPESREIVYRGRPVPLGEVAYRRFNQKLVDLIADKAARGADDATLYAFLEIAARYDFDPLSGEIWCAKMGGKDGGGGKLAIMVGRDGFLKVARRDGAFVDIYGDVIYSEDHFEVEHVRKAGEPLTVTVEHRWGNPATRGEAQGAWGLLLREGKPDRFFYAPLDQYARDAEKSAWKYRDGMILKCMQSYLARTTYGISGPVPIDELNAGLDLPTDGPSAPQTGQEAEGPAPMPAELRTLLQRATDLDPKSWRRNEVEARIYGPDGALLADQVRRVRTELEDWLQDNEPQDAVVVEDAAEPPAEAPSAPAEEGGESAGGQDQAPPPASAEDREKLAALEKRAANLERRFQAAPEGSREAEEASDELDMVNARIAEYHGQDTLL